MTDFSSTGIKRLESKGCACLSAGTAFIYVLPKQLDVDVLPYLLELGTQVMSFEKTHLLKIQTTDFVITGIRKLKEIRFTLKTPARTDLIEKFENCLIKYVLKM